MSKHLKKIYFTEHFDYSIGHTYLSEFDIIHDLGVTTFHPNLFFSTYVELVCLKAIKV